MKSIDSIELTENECMALREIQRRVTGLFQVDSIILFGSVVRGEKDEESDIDLLILTTQKIERSDSHKITDIVFKRSYVKTQLSRCKEFLNMIKPIIEGYL